MDHHILVVNLSKNNVIFFFFYYTQFETMSFLDELIIKNINENSTLMFFVLFEDVNCKLSQSIDQFKSKKTFFLYIIKSKQTLITQCNQKKKKKV